MDRTFRNRAALPASLLLATLLSACLSTGSGPKGVALPQAGVDQYRLVEGQASSAAGCQFDYRVFVPDTSPFPSESPDEENDRQSSSATGPLVVIGHGFLRHQDTMSTLARHVANAGHRVSTLEFCNMRPWNGHHVRNGVDMRLLAKHLGADQVVYAGFSAGALAAMLAAADDPNTIGVVTLDLVDQAGLAATAVNALDVPVFGFAGGPSSCNRMGSASALFQNDSQASVTTLTEASHCEFESPTDGWCETACGDDDSDTVNQVQRGAIIDGVVTRVSTLLSGHPDIHASRSDVVTPRHRQ